MSALALKIRLLLVSEDGPTAVEYAVMLALIVIVCIPVVKALATSPTGMFSAAVAVFGS